MAEPGFKCRTSHSNLSSPPGTPMWLKIQVQLLPQQTLLSRETPSQLSVPTLTTLSRVLSAITTVAPSLKNTALLSPGVFQSTKTFHTGQPSHAPVSPLPECGGKVHHGQDPLGAWNWAYLIFPSQRNTCGYPRNHINNRIACLCS